MQTPAYAPVHLKRTSQVKKPQQFRKLPIRYTEHGRFFAE
jgi:hypothetical protein